MEYSKDLMNWFCELPDTAFLHLANVYSCVETYWTFVLIYWSDIFTYELLCWLLIKLFHPLVLPLGTTTRLSYLNLLVVIIWWSDIPPWKEVSQEFCVPLRCPVAPSTTIDIYECVENLNWLITTERLNWTRHNNHSKFGSVPLNPNQASNHKWTENFVAFFVIKQWFSGIDIFIIIHKLCVINSDCTKSVIYMYGLWLNVNYKT